MPRSQTGLPSTIAVSPLAGSTRVKVKQSAANSASVRSFPPGANASMKRSLNLAGSGWLICPRTDSMSRSFPSGRTAARQFLRMMIDAKGIAEGRLSEPSNGILQKDADAREELQQAAQRCRVGSG